VEAVGGAGGVGVAGAMEAAKTPKNSSERRERDAFAARARADEDRRAAERGMRELQVRLDDAVAEAAEAKNKLGLALTQGDRVVQELNLVMRATGYKSTPT
jgi:hypothetical protein